MQVYTGVTNFLKYENLWIKIFVICNKNSTISISGPIWCITARYMQIHSLHVDRDMNERCA